MEFWGIAGFVLWWDFMCGFIIDERLDKMFGGCDVSFWLFVLRR